jgi:hypothetical protein
MEHAKKRGIPFPFHLTEVMPGMHRNTNVINPHKKEPIKFIQQEELDKVPVSINYK